MASQILQPLYASSAAIAVTSWSTGLAAGQWASSALVDNTSLLYDDAICGGNVTTGTGFVAGDVFELYAYGVYSDTATDIGGAIAAAGAFNGVDEELTEGTAFQSLNLFHIMNVSIDQASKHFQFGPFTIAGVFPGGGQVLPPKWGIMGHNAGTGTMAATPSLSYIGVNPRSVDE